MKIDMLMLLVLAVPGPQNSIKEALTKHWQTSADFTIAVGCAMPAASYIVIRAECDDNFRLSPTIRPELHAKG